MSTTLNKRLLRYFGPLVVVPVALIIWISIFFSYSAAISRSREIAELRAETLSDDFNRQFRAVRDLGFEGISFYRQRLIETFLNDAASTSGKGQGVLLATGVPLVFYGTTGVHEPGRDDPVFPHLAEKGYDPFTVVSSGAAFGLPRGRYVFSGQYNMTPAIWIIAYESIDSAIEPVRTTAMLTGAVGFLSFLFSLFLANRFARRISEPLIMLTRVVTAFGIGNQRIRAELDDDTEVGILASEFNEMADKITRFTATLEDQVRMRTEELNHSLTELQETQAHLLEAEKHRAMGNLVSGLAHELNTPIGVAITATDYLRQTVDTPGASVEEMKKALSSSTQLTLESLNRVAGMIRRLQQLTETARDEEYKMISMEDFFRDWFPSLQSRFDARGIEVIIEGNCYIETATYPIYLWQVIASLAENVLDHAFPADAYDTPQFLISCESEGDSLQLYVKDNGVGVTEDNAPRLFEPFYTTRRDIGKVGLNLHIGYTLVHGKLGGTVQYLLPHERTHLSGELAEPGGACFVISIPFRGGGHPRSSGPSPGI